MKISVRVEDGGGRLMETMVADVRRRAEERVRAEVEARTEAARSESDAQKRDVQGGGVRR